MADERNIGDMAEAHFANLCAAEGLVANPSQRDRVGWDFIVEPQPLVVVNGNELHTEPLLFNAQVKGTTNKRGTVKVKLSTLLHLCRSSSPAFIVIVVYGEGMAPISTFLLHLGENEMERVWRRVYDEVHAVEGKPLSKVFLTFRPCGPSCAEINQDRSLTEIARSFIGADLSAYRTAKQDLIKHTGLEGFFLNLEFSAESLPKLQRIFLGLEDSVEFLTSEGKEKRFGYEIPSELVLAGPGTMKVGPNEEQVRVFFSNDSFASEVSFDARLFVVPSLAVFDDDEPALRIAADLFELTATREGKFKINFSTDVEKKCRMPELQQRARLWEMLVDTYGLSLRFETSKSSSGTFQLPRIKGHEGFTNAASLVNVAREVFVSLGIYNEVNCSLGGLSDMEDRLALLHGMFVKEVEAKMKVNFFADIEGMPQETHCVLGQMFILDDVVVCVVSSHQAKIEVLEGEHVVYLNKPQVEAKVFSGQPEEAHFFVKAEVERVKLKEARGGRQAFPLFLGL